MVVLKSLWIVAGALFLGFWIWKGKSLRTAPKRKAPFSVDFTAEPRPSWRAINDNVMGGISEGRLAWEEAGMHWTGATRLENNGGFASVRGSWVVQDLSGIDRVVVRCRGTGGPFKLVLERGQRWWMPYLCADFSPAETWTDIVIPFEEIRWSQAFAGDLPNIGINEALKDVLRIGLMKYDGTAQTFDLEIARISFE